jgi:ABC-type phosphate transport system auxiliary subunit
MATDKQTAANRLNAQKSTGPRTPEGRAAVRLNGVKHGLTAETIVLKGESESDFTGLLDSLEAEHDPVTPTEEALVVQLAMATWRLRRLYHQEAGFYTCQLQSLVGMQKDLSLDDAGRMGHAAAWSESTLNMFNRQEGRLERTFYRALHELQRLRKEREANLASVLQPTPVGQVPDLPISEINNIHQPAPDMAPASPVVDPAPTAQNGIHIVPPAADMQ